MDRRKENSTDQYKRLVLQRNAKILKDPPFLLLKLCIFLKAWIFLFDIKIQMSKQFIKASVRFLFTSATKVCSNTFLQSAATTNKKGFVFFGKSSVKKTRHTCFWGEQEPVGCFTWWHDTVTGEPNSNRIRSSKPDQKNCVIIFGTRRTTSPNCPAALVCARAQLKPLSNSAELNTT